MNMGRAKQVTYFLLRVVPGLLFFQAGSMKLLGWFGGMPGQPGSTAPLMSQIGVGGVLEYFGGLAIMLGLLTRPVASILSGGFAVSYCPVHAPNGLCRILNYAEPAVLFCLIFLYMAPPGGV